jgi:hypothetical protein
VPGEILDMSEHWLTATIELGAIYVRQATVESKDTADAFSKQAYPSIPLQNCLFTPELQWQSRGQMAYLTGETLWQSSMKCRRSSAPPRALPATVISPPSILAALTLSCSGDPGVNDVSHRGTCLHRPGY